MNQAPFFNAQFFDDDGTPLAGGFLHTYLSGTTTPHATYQDQAGDTPNTNPIELDAAGRCDLWLDPDVEYTFLLERADETEVKTWDDVVGTAVTSDSVTSVNGDTGAITLAAEDIPFTTGTSTDWFVGTDVAAALDAIITHQDGAIAASSITIVDAGLLYTATNVEGALAEVRELVDAVVAFPDQSGNSGKYLKTNGTSTLWDSPLPSQTGNSGKFLGTDGTTASWQTGPTGSSTQSANGTITFPGGLIMKWGTTSTLALDSDDNSVSFPTAFPNNCFAVTGSASTDNGVGSDESYSVGIHTWTVNGFKVNNDSDATTVTWIAIGN